MGEQAGPGVPLPEARMGQLMLEIGIGFSSGRVGRGIVHLRAASKVGRKDEGGEGCW